MLEVPVGRSLFSPVGHSGIQGGTTREQDYILCTFGRLGAKYRMTNTSSGYSLQSRVFWDEEGRDLGLWQSARSSSTSLPCFLLSRTLDR